MGGQLCGCAPGEDSGVVGGVAQIGHSGGRSRERPAPRWGRLCGHGARARRTAARTRQSCRRSARVGPGLTGGLDSGRYRALECRAGARGLSRGSTTWAGDAGSLTPAHHTRGVRHLGGRDRRSPPTHQRLNPPGPRRARQRITRRRPGGQQSRWRHRARAVRAAHAAPRRQRITNDHRSVDQSGRAPFVVQRPGDRGRPHPKAATATTGRHHRRSQHRRQRTGHRDQHGRRRHTDSPRPAREPARYPAGPGQTTAQ